MKKKFGTILAVLIITISASAQTTQDSIMDLATQIRRDIVNSTASPQSLTEALNRLKEASDLINKNTSSSSEECYNFSYPKYYVSFSSAAAAEKARNLCKTVGAMDVLNFLYPKYYISFSSVTSLEKAAALSSINVQGKLDMIQFAYEKFYISFSATTSSEKSVSIITPVPRGSLACVKKYYTSYYTSYSSATAIEKAAKACEN